MSTYSQLFPPNPTFTENHLLDLSSKVYLITGATSGIGLALAKTLYTLHATRRRADSHFLLPGLKGPLNPFIADLADLEMIKPAVKLFLKEEYRLGVPFLNAAVMTPPAGGRTVDGFDLGLGVNRLAPFLLKNLLLPLMQSVSMYFCHLNTSIRVIWVSSLLNLSAPSGGVQLVSSNTATQSSNPRTNSWAPKQITGMQHYMQTKAGDYLLAQEFSRWPPPPSPSPTTTTTTTSSPALIQKPNNVLHISLNPGFLRNNRQRHAPAPLRGIMTGVFKGPKHGAYTELYAGLGPDVKQGDFVIPWGRKGSVSEHVSKMVAGEDGKRSVSARFYEWCEEQVKPFM